jgi:hypothetical protein
VWPSHVARPRFELWYRYRISVPFIISDKHVYCRLSHTHKVFHYGDCDENSQPTTDQLPNKCKFIAIFMLRK